MNPSAVSTSPTVTESISLEPFLYSLDHECPVPWPSQDNAVNQQYPFHCINDESPHEFVIKRYLETLWLPESIMPLPHLVKSLRRIVFPSSRAQAVHSALKPLLLSVRATHDKYHKELPQILQDGCGVGEIEEAMMWYSWSRENFQPDGNDEDNDAGRNCEDTGKKAWMEQKERREVQIQILLYFHLISVLPPSQSAPVVSPKKRRKHMRDPPSPIKSFKSSAADVDEDLRMEDRLEFLMDKLSLWQLMESLTPSGSYPSTSQPKANDQRDWMQIFCEEVVEPLFRDRLPELCDLLRTKVFPHSPFSEDSDSVSSPPPIRPAKKLKTKGKRPPSPLRLQELRKSHSTRSQAGSTQPPVTPIDARDPSAPQRNRSRSRSVSVSVEEVRARGANRGGVTSSKNLWKGEIAMKRTSSRGSQLFNPPPVDSQTRDAEKMTRHDSTMPSEAQMCASESRLPSQLRDPRTLAADTPVKKKIIKVEDAIVPNIVMDSPDELLLTSKLQWHDVDENDSDSDKEGLPVPLTTIFAADTPVKIRK